MDENPGILDGLPWLLLFYWWKLNVPPVAYLKYGN